MIKLGRDTGSLVNYMLGNYGQTTVPEVGMGVTIFGWSDRHAGTIVELFIHRKRNMMKVQHDHAVRTDKNGFSESQEYEYERNPNGITVYYRQNLEGRWEHVRKAQEWEKGQWIKEGGSLRLGEREEYYDFSF